MSSTSSAPSITSPTPPVDNRVKAWGFTGLLMVLYTLNWADKAVYGLAAQPLAEEFGLSTGQLGFIGSMFFIALTVGSFLAGVMGRYFTLKWCLAIMAIGWSFAMLPVVLAGGFTVLLLSRMLLGLLEGPGYPFINTALFTWHPRERRGLPSACITASSSIAKIVVAPLLALVIASWGWRTAFVLLAGSTLVWLLVWLPTWKVGPHGADTPAARRTSGQSTDTVTGDGEHATEPAVPLLHIIATPTFYGGAISCMTMYAIVTVVLTWLPSYFEMGLGFSRVEAGFLFALPALASLVVMIALTILSDQLIGRGTSSRLLRGIMPSVGLVMTGISLALLPFIPGQFGAAVFISIGYSFGASIFPLLNAAVSEVVPPRQMSAVLGLMTGIMVLGGVYGPWLTGLIVDAAATPVAGYTTAFQVFGVMALVGGIIGLLGINPERDKLRLQRRQAGQQPMAQ